MCVAQTASPASMIDDAFSVVDSANAMTIRILGSEICKDHDTDSMHVNYVISVICPAANVSWRVSRRYRMFKELAGKLRPLLGGKRAMPALPGKSLRRSFKQKYVEEQQGRLEDWLLQLGKMPAVVNSAPWCSFLVSTFNDIFAPADDRLQQADHQLIEDARRALEECSAVKDERDQLREKVEQHTALSTELTEKLATLREEQQKERVAHKTEVEALQLRLAILENRVDEQDSEVLRLTQALKDFHEIAAKERKEGSQLRVTTLSHFG